MSQLRAVAVPAQVPEVEVSKLGGDDLFGSLRGGVVGQMTVPAQDALLHTPRSLRVILKELQVVIGLEDEDVGRPNPLDDELGCVAQISEEADVAGGRPQEEPDRIVGVVGNGKGIHSDIPHLEGLAGLKDLAVEPGLNLGLDGFARKPIAAEGDAVPRAYGGESLDVVGVFVGDEYGLERFRSASDAGEPLADLPAAETGIDQQARLVGFQVGAIAARTAPEDGQLHRHGMTVGRGRIRGNCFRATPG